MDPVAEYTPKHRSWNWNLVMGLAVQLGSELLTDAVHVVARFLGHS
ncbi:hypothetical protein [Streptomyces lydicus]